jgi:hypothetical protein
MTLPTPRAARRSDSPHQRNEAPAGPCAGGGFLFAPGDSPSLAVAHPGGAARLAPEGKLGGDDGREPGRPAAGLRRLPYHRPAIACGYPFTARG